MSDATVDARTRTGERARSRRPTGAWSMVLLAACALGTANTVRGAVRSHPSLEPTASASRSAAAQRALALLTQQGTEVTAGERIALRALVGVWSRRPDLRSALSTSDGAPDVDRLLAWVLPAPDSDSLELIDHRLAFVALAQRRNVPYTTDPVVEALYATVAHRFRPITQVSGAFWRLIEVLRARPEVVAAYTRGEQLDARGLLWWAANVAEDDRAASVLVPLKWIFLTWLDEQPVR